MNNIWQCYSILTNEENVAQIEGNNFIKTWLDRNEAPNVASGPKNFELQILNFLRVEFNRPYTHNDVI